VEKEIFKNVSHHGFAKSILEFSKIDEKATGLL